MCGGGGGGDQTITNEPSEQQKPYIDTFYSLTQDLLERGPESQFPLFGLAPRSQSTIDAETLALAGLGPSDASQAGINALIASASPSAGTQAGVQNIYDTLGASDLTLSGLQGTLDAAQPSDLTLLGQEGALNAAGTQMDLGASGADALLAALDPSSAQNQAIIDPFIEKLQADILPSIGSTAVRQGAFGGSRQAIQEQRAAEGVAGAATQALLRNQLAALDRLGQAQGGLLRGANTISDVGRDQEEILQNIADAEIAVGGALEGIDDQVTSDLLRAGGIEEDITGRAADTLLDAGALVEDYAAGDIQTLSDVGRQQEGYGQAVLDQLAAGYGFDDRALQTLIDQFGTRIFTGNAGNVQTSSGGGGFDLGTLLGLGTALYGLSQINQ